ncbi:outer membrane protein transport protein [Sulfuricurvum sp.]|uniref:OmpP1/FadL family transporter n=1 Tax=Sulfuricurvum sp. TaxID=2025608 RepID=UPI002639FFCD|nr:outer membrane protein transport protein [Sulfuricurvum sp.]MDD3595246.1 outer membrane protein transport protein [Sulfuricurvum sp.]
MRVATLSIIASATLVAGGYKIPENSVNATALCAAYVANAHGADAAYYNPAAMVYNDDVGFFEADATYIGLPPIDFSGVSGEYSSKRENYLIPTLHYASGKLGNSSARVGLSVVIPAGLSKRWDDIVPRSTAQEFTLRTIEINPSVAFALSDTVSFGVGFRVLSSEGVVKSTAAVSRDMEGSSVDYGYNLALMYKPSSAWKLAATYRSNIDLTLEGDAKLYVGAPIGTPVYNVDVSVTIPLPAALNLAAAYTFGSGTTVEAVYERTFWSKYKQLDFNYPVSIAPLTPYFDDPKAKNWENSNSYRFGVTHTMDAWTWMGGLEYDETPVPADTLGYELPDSDAWVVSLGGRYQIDSQWNVGLSGLFDVKKSRDVANSSINGEFSNARVYLVTAGVEYRF